MREVSSSSAQVREVSGGRWPDKSLPSFVKPQGARGGEARGVGAQRSGRSPLTCALRRFHKLEKWRRPFYRVLQVYENASVLLPAFYNTRNTDVSIRVKYVLDDFESPQAVYYFHPQYLVNVSRYWLSLGVRAKRISTGLILATAALELCEEVHLFGFWAFPMNPSGLYITHHYYDNVKPRPGFHAMPSEIFNFLHLHSRGILRVHTGTCSCC